eukprot:gene3853-7685_t
MFIISGMRELRPERFHEGFTDHMSLLARFEQHVNKCIDLYISSHGTYVAPYTAVCQARGLGKSRLVKEYARTHPVAYFSFATESSYPPRTPIVINQLIDHIRTHHNTSHIQNIFETFIISAVLQILDLVNVSKLSCEEIFERQVPAPGSGTSEEFWKWNKLKKSDLNEKKSFLKSNACIEKRVVIVFDEASFLIENSSIAGGGILFQIMRISLKNTHITLGSLGIELFGIFVDASSTISYMSPGMEREYSSKKPSLLLLPPFYLVNTMNCFVYNAYWPLTIEDAFSIKRISSYSRPLFASYLTEDSDRNDVYYLTQYVIMRLLGRQRAENVNDMSTSHSENIAVLGSRITLSIVPSSPLAVTQSAKHLRYIAHLINNSELVYTVAPSEPIVSDLAANIMRGQRKVVFLESLLVELYSGSIVSGSCRPQLVSQFLLILTRDEVIYTSRLGNFSTFTVRSFLQCLNEKCIPSVSVDNDNDNDKGENKKKKQKKKKKKQDDNIVDMPILDGIISFNHFARMDCTPSIEHLTDCFVRMAAVQCPQRLVHDGIDFIIPVLLSERGTFTRQQRPRRPSRSEHMDSTSVDGTKNENDDHNNKDDDDDEEDDDKDLSAAQSSKFWNNRSVITPDRMSFILVQVRYAAVYMDDIDPFDSGIVLNDKFPNNYITMKIALNADEEKITCENHGQVLAIEIHSLESFSCVTEHICEALYNVLEATQDPLPFCSSVSERLLVASMCPGRYK